MVRCIIRPAVAAALPQMTALLLQDAQQRHRVDPDLWAIGDDAAGQIAQAVGAALRGEDQPFRQAWIVAELGDALVGLVHSMLLPVPPIYAGNLGVPGLMLPEMVVTQAAPAGTTDALLAAAEADLAAAGARLLLASFVTGEDWRASLVERGYEPLTLYLSKSGLAVSANAPGVRRADGRDIPGIVAKSALNRAILGGLDPFWTPHAEADGRFDGWMRRSLTLTDRDMMVAGGEDGMAGYAIAQPASRLHFPPAHEIARTGVLDDFFHDDFADPARLPVGCEGAAGLLQSAEAAFVRLGMRTAFVVCPAAWRSKRELLERAGYRTAMTWMRKRQ